MKTLFDGMLGAIVASESMRCSTVINGPGGCRSRAQIVMEMLIPDYEEESMACMDSPHYGKQSALPCTYLNGTDVIYGAGPKVRSAADAARGAYPDLPVTVIDTLAASLMCTDPRSAGRAAYLSDDLSAMSFSEGYDICSERVFSKIDLDEGCEEGSVCLLGYGIADLGWTDGLEEIRDLLSLMGVRTVLAPGGRPSPEVLKACGKADISISMDPARTTRTAELLRRERGVRPLFPSAGSPVGWDATESLLREVGDMLGLDPSPAVRAVEDERERVRMRQLGNMREMMMLGGRCFDAYGPSATLYPLTRWMMEDYRMAPRKLEPVDGYYADRLEEIRRPFGDTLRSRSALAVVFTDGIEADEGRATLDPASHVELFQPTTRPFDLMGRTLVGRKGCRYIIDEMVNSARRMHCGQPFPVDFK